MSLLLLFRRRAVSLPPPAFVPAPDFVPIDDVAIELALDGSYYDNVMLDAPVAFWLLNEQLASTGAREQVGTLAGTYVGGLEGGAHGPFPHGGTAMTFDGIDGHVNVGDVAALALTDAFSVEFFIKTTDSGFKGLVGKGDASISIGGWRVFMDGGKVAFHATTDAGAQVFFVDSPTTLNDGVWHHIVATFDGGTGGGSGGGHSLLLLLGSRGSQLAGSGGSGFAKLYVDGELVAIANSTASAIIGTPPHDFAIGAMATLGNTMLGFLDGAMAGVAVYETELLAEDVERHWASTQWTDVTADVLVDNSTHVSLEYGTRGSKPLDRLANTGTLEFTLDNSQFNSAGLLGYYSPRHGHARPGLAHDIPVRAIVTYDGTPRVKFWGRIVALDPLPGEVRARRTLCLAHDYMSILTDTDVRMLEPQLGQDEVTLVRAVFDALPFDAQPMALALDGPLDIYTYAFDDLAGGRKAATAISHVLVSAWAKGWVRGDGAFVMQNRQAGANADIAYVVDGEEMFDLMSASDRSDVFNHVRTVVHPRDTDLAAVVLFKNDSKLFVPANEQVELWGTYRNPARENTAGGFDMVTPVSGTDYAGNSAADGSGSVMTGDLVITASFFASTVKLTVQNTHATLGAYLVDGAGAPLLQVRGKGIYNLSPVTSEAPKSAPRRSRPLTVDLHYQDDSNKGQSLADFILREREIILDPVTAITVDPHTSVEMMQLALDGEPGALLTVTELQTGLIGAQVAVRSVRLTIGPALIMRADLGLSPILIGTETWVLDDPELSLLGETTILGYG